MGIFPLRLFQYYYRLFDRYKKPIIILAILTDDNKSWRPTSYQTAVWDFPILRFNFQICKLLDYQNNKQALEISNNPFSLVVLAHLGVMETKRDPQARYELKFNLTRRLYEKGYNRDYVLNLYKMLDWVYRSYLKMRTFQIQSERYTRSHDGRKTSFRAVIQGDNRNSPLENPHRARKAPQIANSQLEVQWVY